MVYIGKVGDFVCQSSRYSANQSVCITGMSGCGKTCKLQQIELELVKERPAITVIVLDLNHTHTDDQIFKDIVEDYREKVNRIRIVDDGIRIDFCGNGMVSGESKSSWICRVNSVVAALCFGQRFGSKQVAALREAVVYAFEHEDDYAEHLKAIEAGLIQQKSSSALQVRAKLWTIFESGIIRKEPGKRIKEGKINIFDFSELDEITKSIMIELFLYDFWSKIQRHKPNFNRTALVLDEFQNLNLRILLGMLREGRKYGLSLLLATQTLATFSKDERAVIGQAAIRLYFQPENSRLRTVAKDIFAEDADVYVKKLQELRVGQCIAVGDLEINGKGIHRPIVVD